MSEKQQDRPQGRDNLSAGQLALAREALEAAVAATSTGTDADVDRLAERLSVTGTAATGLKFWLSRPDEAAPLVDEWLPLAAGVEAYYADDGQGERARQDARRAAVYAREEAVRVAQREMNERFARWRSYGPAERACYQLAAVRPKDRELLLALAGAIRGEPERASAMPSDDVLRLAGVIS